MSGIYLHIPFCRKACLYCDFHFSTQTTYTDRMVNAIAKETNLRSGFLSSPVETIYFGGGTPSVLSQKQIEIILNEIHQSFSVSPEAEITLEANPDDLNPEYVKILKDAGINRLSIGLQSFDDDVLQWMNRSHVARQSNDAVRMAQDLGFDNITIDLIFGIPGKDNRYWNEQLVKALELKVNHLSVYSLTVEESTTLHHRIRKGIQAPPVPEEQAEQFLMAMDLLTGEGFEHYEISNYALPGYRSRHNASYWTGRPYLGIGPSAHSFDGAMERSWNVSSNHLYMKGMEDDMPLRETETLTQNDRINEYILTRLRTSEGLSLSECVSQFGHEIGQTIRQQWTESGHLAVQRDQLQLTREGKLIADTIASSLFVL